MTSSAEAWQSRNQLASDWMHQGFDLVAEGSPSALERAVGCFDQAIALRKTLPLEEIAFLRYGLSAGWINRGDALARLARLPEAVASYDEALRLLQTLPPEENPLYPRRLAIAWINRGTALRALAKPDGKEEIARSFRQALAVLDHPASAEVEDHAALRAGAQVNLAGELSSAEARAAARAALEIALPGQETNAALAEAALQARHLLARLAVRELADRGRLPEEALGEALAAAREGVALGRRWHARAGDRFDPLARDLFRFGCRLHAQGTPTLLADFLAEGLERDGFLDAEGFDAAHAAIWSLFSAFQADGFRQVGTPGFVSFMEGVAELRALEERLRERLDPR